MSWNRLNKIRTNSAIETRNWAVYHGSSGHKVTEWVSIDRRF
jgi:hypothetical protein